MHHIIQYSTSALLVTSLLISTSLVQTTQDGASGPHEQLAHLSYFQTESHAMLFGRDSSTIDAEVRVLEQYSNEHGRARLDFQSQEFATNGRARNDHDDDGYLLPRHVEYIFSAKSNKLLRISKVPTAARPRCELSNRTALASDLFGLEASWIRTRQVSDSRAPELAEWERLLSGLKMPGYVIGFARLLVFVELNRQGFRRVERSQGATLRNAQVEQFKLTFKVPEWGGDGEADSRWVAPIAGNEAIMIIYLSKQQDSGAGASQHPFRVWLQMPSGAELIVDFSSVGPMRAAAAASTSSLQGASGDLMSMFNFPLGRGCSQQLSGSGADGDAITESHRSPPPVPSRKQRAIQSVFSFEAQLSELWFRERPARLAHLFVAYDAHAKALRVDSRAADGEETTTTTIHDFALGRKYHSITGGGDSEDPNRSVLSVESTQNRASSGRQCLVTRISAKEQADMLDDRETILPWDSLIEMGSALVRGIETQVYEMVSERLPRFLFQQVAYLDLAGNEQLAFNLKRKVSASTTGDTQIGFSIVYFVASTSAGNRVNESKDQLIRVDVYQRDMLLYRADIFNFQWHLTDAPDGQLDEELFSLDDTAECSLPTTGGVLLRPPARMHLELVYVTNAQMFHVLSKDIIELLASSPARHKALIRSLAGYSSNSLFSSQIRDLKTTIYGLDGLAQENVSDTYGSIRLAMDLELAGLPRSEDIALKAVSIGTALSSGLKKPSTKSATLEQCFWEAAREFAATAAAAAESQNSETSAVLFSFCSFKCWIDSQATVSKWPSNKRATATGELLEEPLEFHSSVFMISMVSSRLLPCELLRIQRDTTTQLSGDNELIWPWRDVQQNLQDKILSLVFVNEQQSGSNNASKHPELLFKASKVAFTGPDENHDLDQQPQLVDGVSLPAEVSLETFQMDSPESLDQAPEACHAHCVAHLDCRSYSVCHGQQRAYCTISALELDTSELHKQLAAFYQLDKQSPERKSSWISVASGNQPEEKISLRVNKRCQVRTVRAQEMFGLRKKEHGAARRTVWLTHLLPVANQSECAQMCLGKNVNFFKRLASLRPANSDGHNLELEPKLAGEKPVELRNQLSYAMRFWCHAFYFLDTKLEPVSYQLMGKLHEIWVAAGTLGPTASGNSWSGLCYLARPQWAPADYTPRAKITKAETIASKEQVPKSASVDQQEPELVKLPFSEHEFRYSLLYERHQGFRLARIPSANEPNEQASSLVIENNQLVESHPPDIEFCARQCFSQAAHWCRSFDVITFMAVDRSVSSTISCIYNSLSLQDAWGDNSSLLLKLMSFTQKSSKIGYDHYEPHRAYALDNVALSYLNELESANQLAVSQPQQLLNLDGHLPRTRLNLIVCILMGVCTGAAVALVMMTQFYRKNHMSRHVRSHMNVPRLSREFICMDE